LAKVTASIVTSVSVPLVPLVAWSYCVTTSEGNSRTAHSTVAFPPAAYFENPN